LFPWKMASDAIISGPVSVRAGNPLDGPLDGGKRRVERKRGLGLERGKNRQEADTRYWRRAGMASYLKNSAWLIDALTVCSRNGLVTR
jgi:hypothetical protein